jgi:hypothetical protein
MSRYKGRASLTSLAREFPYTVETAVPEGGLGRSFDRMYEFHAVRGITAQTGKGRRVDDCDIVTWLFADPEIAQQFAAEFNGTMLLPATIL